MAVKPHKSRYWLNTPNRKTAAFKKEAKTICNLYLKAKKLYAQGVHLISTDEKTGIQALERLAPNQPASPGKLELYEFEYIRHGTLCLTANLEVASGRILKPTLAQTRTAENFVKHIEQTTNLDRKGKWIFILDNLNTHLSEPLVRWVAKRCGIKKDLGEKGKSGILKSMASRKVFLENKKHAVRFAYTPKHASWLNQIEIWFSTLVRRLLRRGSFKTLAQLRKRILKFIKYFNSVMAKPYKWIYTPKEKIA